MQNLDQELRVDNLVTPQDVPSSATYVRTNSGMFRSMAKYRKGLVVVTGYLTSGKTAIATLKSADDADGTNSNTMTATAYTATLTGQASGPTNEVGTIEFDVNDLIASDEDEHFVGVDIITTQDGNEVAAVLVRGAARWYQGSSMPA